MMSEEECRKRIKELLQIPKEDLLTKYMFQEQEINKLTAESTEWESKYYELQEKITNNDTTIDRLKKEYIISEEFKHQFCLHFESKDNMTKEDYEKIVSKAIENMRIKELKENNNE